MSNCRFGPNENDGDYGHGRGVCNSRQYLDAPGEDQEDDGTGYEGDEEGFDSTFRSYGADYWKERMEGKEGSDTDTDDGGNEVAKEGQEEKKEPQEYWIDPESGKRVPVYRARLIPDSDEEEVEPEGDKNDED